MTTYAHNGHTVWTSLKTWFWFQLCHHHINCIDDNFWQVTSSPGYFLYLYNEKIGFLKVYLEKKEKKLWFRRLAGDLGIWIFIGTPSYSVLKGLQILPWEYCVIAHTKLLHLSEIFKYQHTSESLGILTYRFLGLTPRQYGSVSLGWNQIICIPIKLHG